MASGEGVFCSNNTVGITLYLFVHSGCAKLVIIYCHSIFFSRLQQFWFGYYGKNVCNSGFSNEVPFKNDQIIYFDWRISSERCTENPPTILFTLCSEKMCKCVNAIQVEAWIWQAKMNRIWIMWSMIRSEIRRYTAHLFLPFICALQLVGSDWIALKNLLFFILIFQLSLYEK